MSVELKRVTRQETVLSVACFETLRESDVGTERIGGPRAGGDEGVGKLESFESGTQSAGRLGWSWIGRRD